MDKTKKRSKQSPKPAPAKRKPGRPEGGGFKPTAEQRNMVEQLAGLLIPERDISLLVINPETRNPITPVTLRKHFRAELDVGLSKVKVRHHMALMKAVESGNVTAMIWMDKTRFGIRERLGIEVPIPTAADAVPGAQPEAVDTKSLDVARRIAYVLALGAAMPAAAAPAKAKPAPKPQKATRKAKQAA